MRLFVALAALFITSSVLAQEARNGAYFELGGSGVLSSVNYERHFANGLAGRAGFFVVTGESENDSDTTFVLPLTLSKITNRSGNHHFEYGGGVTIATGDRQDLYDTADNEDTFSAVVLTGIAGYRYQKPGRGVIFRATFTPFLSGGDFLPWAGVSIGYAW